MSLSKDLFEPIDHGSVVDSVVARIEELILTGVLKDGQKLPSERELAERLSVSRPKLREAFKVLESRELIVARHGGGTFVAELVGSAMSPALISLYARHTGAFLDYLEYRAAQEGFAAYLAAERSTSADKDILQMAMNDLINAHETQDEVASRNADFQFHTAIMDASHNSLLTHSMTSIYELSKQNLFYNRAFLRELDGSGEKLLQQHRNIFEAITSGQPDEAKAASIAHVRFVEKSYTIYQTRRKREAVANRRLALSKKSQSAPANPGV